MEYFKYKHKTIGDFGDPSRVTYSLNLPHSLNDKQAQKDAQIDIKDFVAKDRFNDFSACVVNGTNEQIKTFISSQSSHIGLTKITKSEFETLKQASFTYQREQEILNELKQTKLDEIQKERDARLKDSALKIEGVGVVDAGRAHLQNISSLIKICESSNAPSLAFRLRDNTSANLSLAQLKLIELEMSKAAAMIYQKCWQLSEAIKSASDFNSVQAIKWGNDE